MNSRSLLILGLALATLGAGLVAELGMSSLGNEVVEVVAIAYGLLLILIAVADRLATRKR